MQRRHLSAIAMVVVVAVTAGACATSADTTAVDDVEPAPSRGAPTSSVMRTERAAGSTTTTIARSSELASAGTDPASVLTSLLGRFAADPALASQLANLDAVGIANLLGIDVSAVQLLGLDPAQLTALAQGVVGSAPTVQDQLRSGAPDPAVLLGLLAGSLDLASLADGTLATIVQGLLAAVTGLRIVVSPELTVDLGELLGEFDPDGLGQFAANPANASLLALLTSAFIGANPLLTDQLLANPLLDPSLSELLGQLRELNLSISDTARLALLAALSQLFPGFLPG